VAGLARLCLFVLAGELIRLLVPHRGSGAVLVVRLDAIGDFLIWLGVGAGDIAQLARRRGRSVLLAKQDWAAFAGSLNLFDEVWPVDTERLKFDPLYRFKLQLRLRRQGFDLLIQPRAAREFLLEDLLIRVVGSPEVVGSLGNTRNITPRLKRIGDRWHTRLIEVPPESAHEMERSRTFARALVGHEPSPVAIDFDPGVPARLGLTADYFVVAPGAGWAGRRWPPERFGDLAARLQLQTGWQCVVVGGGGDLQAGTTIIGGLGHAVNLAGRTSLLDTGAVLKQARLVLANESGTAHYAPFVGTRAVVLLGGGHFGWFMPYGDALPERLRPLSVYRRMECYGCDWKCRYDLPASGAVRCLDEISVDDVWMQIQKILGEPSGGVPAAAGARPQ
jgi:ADP-heptose:LPS heptosyltransferase